MTIVSFPQVFQQLNPDYYPPRVEATEEWENDDHSLFSLGISTVESRLLFQVFLWWKPWRNGKVTTIVTFPLKWYFHSGIQSIISGIATVEVMEEWETDDHSLFWYFHNCCP